MRYYGIQDCIGAKAYYRTSSSQLYIVVEPRTGPKAGEAGPEDS